MLLCVVIKKRWNIASKKKKKEKIGNGRVRFLSHGVQEWISPTKETEYWDGVLLREDT